MKQMGYLTKALNINTHRPYLTFYRLLHDKKRSIKYTMLVFSILNKFKRFYRNTVITYVNLYFFNFYKNPIFLSNITYFYILKKCKYVNANFFIDLTHNTYILKKHKFLFLFNNSNNTQQELIAGRFDLGLRVFLYKNNYILYKQLFNLANPSFISVIIKLNLILYYIIIQLIVKNNIINSFDRSFIIRQKIFFKIFNNKEILKNYMF